MMRVIRDLARLVTTRKRYWLIPVLAFLLLIVIVVVISVHAGVAAPFIYPLF